MAFPPPPLTFLCPRCSWQRTTLPKSDALVIGRDCFNRCPECAYEPLESRAASKAEVLRARLGRFLRLDRH